MPLSPETKGASAGPVSPARGPPPLEAAHCSSARDVLLGPSWASPRVSPGQTCLSLGTAPLVPTGRFELPHLAALAPQASVSTNSTTSAIVKRAVPCAPV